MTALLYLAPLAGGPKMDIAAMLALFSAMDIQRR
jgi:hypothetical protein